MAQTSLKLQILLPRPLQYWGYIELQIRLSFPFSFFFLFFSVLKTFSKLNIAVQIGKSSTQEAEVGKAS